MFRADKASGRIGWEGGRVGSGWVGRDCGRGRLFTLQYGAKHAPPPSELSGGSSTELHCAAGIAEREMSDSNIPSLSLLYDGEGLVQPAPFERHYIDQPST